MFLEKSKVQEILNGAPKHLDKGQILDGLVERGHELEGVDMNQARQRVQQISFGKSVTGNQFTEAQEEAKSNRGFLAKARDFTTGIIGGGKLAEGIGQAVAAPGIQNQFDDIQERNAATQQDILQRLRQAKAEGKDTTNLESALELNRQAILQAGDAQSDFGESLASNKQVIGSAARLAGTLAAPSIAKGTTAGTVSPATSGMAGRFAPATGTLGGAARGAKIGATTGAIEGAIQGSGAAAERDATTGQIIGSGAFGATTGGVLGGAIGGVAGGFSGRAEAHKALKAQKEQILRNNPDARVSRYTFDGSGNLVKDKAAQEAIKQGVDEGTLATVKGASQADKTKFNQALDIIEKAKVQGDKKFAALNRPSDVIGDSVMNRFNVVQQANQKAASQLDDVAKSLQGNTVNITPPVRSFIDDLGDMGVTFKNGKPGFTGSSIEDIKPAERLIKKIVQRMQNSTDDAFDAHQLKRFLDEQVAFGKSGEGLTGATEAIVKRLRSNIDEVLDTTFPDYNAVNTQYSGTRNAIDNFLDAAGSKFDVTAPGADKQIGTLARRVLSNAQSRVQVTNALQNLQETAETFGGKFDDDVISQIVFVDELERLFGSSAPTSFQGGIEKGVQRAKSVAGKLKSSEGVFDLALELGGEGLEKLQGINPEGLLTSLREVVN